MGRIEALSAVLLIAAVVPAWPRAAAGQCIANEVSRLEVDLQPNDRFGRSISVSGDLLIVGAPEDDELGSNSGAAYVFRREGSRWVEQTRLTAHDAGANEEFGQSVAVSNGVAVVGARAIDSGPPFLSGAAYVFRLDGDRWVEEAKLIASDAEEGDTFGFAVSIHENLIVVGSIFDSHSGVLRPGSAYVFRHDGDGWVEEATLIAADPQQRAQVGYSVATTGDRVLVGARFTDVGDIVEAGAAHVFRRVGDAWVREDHLTASDASDGDRFGSSVALAPGVAIVGAPETRSDHGGAAYVYRFDGSAWPFERRLASPATGAGNNFGASVCVRGDTALVGCTGTDPDPPLNGKYPPSNTGAAYVYDFNGVSWTEVARLEAATIVDQHQLGLAVALRGNQAIVSTDRAAGNAGAVYVFRGILADCNENGVRDACDVGDRRVDDCDRNWVPDECQASRDCLCDNDVTGDRLIDVDDIVAVIEAWGTPHRYADTNADGVVDVDDLVAVILTWGPCP